MKVMWRIFYRIILSFVKLRYVLFSSIVLHYVTLLSITPLKEATFLYSDEQTIKEFVSWLRNSFPRFHFEIKKPLFVLFPKPMKYTRFWKHHWAHADISVFAGKRLVCVIEPGGFQHLIDKKQLVRDYKKKSICEEKDVYFLPLMNQALKNCENKEFRKLLKNAFYSKKGVTCLM